MPGTSKMPFSNKCNVLSQLWQTWQDAKYDENIVIDKSWEDFFMWADVGLPLAFCVANNLATHTEDGQKIIEDTYSTFCQVMDVSDELEYANLDDILETAYSATQKFAYENE